MNDIISRNDAIEALDFNIVHMTIYSNDDKNGTNPLAQYNKGLEDGIKALKDLPSVEPERKKGRWKPDESGNVYWICSACGFASEAFGADILYHFCPNCGTDMRGKNEKA